MKFLLLSLLSYARTVIGVAVSLACSVVMLAGLFLVGAAFQLVRLTPRPIAAIFIRRA